MKTTTRAQKIEILKALQSGMLKAADFVPHTVMFFNQVAASPGLYESEGKVYTKETLPNKNGHRVFFEDCSKQSAIVDGEGEP